MSHSKYAAALLNERAQGKESCTVQDIITLCVYIQRDTEARTTQNTKYSQNKTDENIVRTKHT